MAIRFTSTVARLTRIILELHSGSMFGPSLSMRLGGDYLNTNQFDTTHRSEPQLAPGESNFYNYGNISVESFRGGASNSLRVNLFTSRGSVLHNYGNHLYGSG